MYREDFQRCRGIEGVADGAGDGARGDQAGRVVRRAPGDGRASGDMYETLSFIA